MCAILIAQFGSNNQRVRTCINFVRKHFFVLHSFIECLSGQQSNETKIKHLVYTIEKYTQLSVMLQMLQMCETNKIISKYS